MRKVRTSCTLYAGNCSWNFRQKAFRSEFGIALSTEATIWFDLQRCANISSARSTIPHSMQTPCLFVRKMIRNYPRNLVLMLIVRLWNKMYNFTAIDSIRNFALSNPKNLPFRTFSSYLVTILYENQWEFCLNKLLWLNEDRQNSLHWNASTKLLSWLNLCSELFGCFKLYFQWAKNRMWMLYNFFWSPHAHRTVVRSKVRIFQCVITTIVEVTFVKYGTFTDSTWSFVPWFSFENWFRLQNNHSIMTMPFPWWIISNWVDSNGINCSSDIWSRFRNIQWKCRAANIWAFT